MQIKKCSASTFWRYDMIKVSPLTDNTCEKFKKLFCDYYAELGCDDDCGHLLDEYILPDVLAGLVKCDILEENGKACGFVLYQIDDIDNEWNLKEGWGDIREIFVDSDHRQNGLGKFVLYTAEMKLKESGADKCYCLPFENAIPFFTACGYEKSEQFNEEMNCFVYTKTNLNNGCGK